MHKLPSKTYVALLDIKAVIRKWQNLELSDRKAMDEINRISIELQKVEWKENHE